ncbi:hypothetical protein V2J09_016748 [Rumex salicifolius]
MLLIRISIFQGSLLLSVNNHFLFFKAILLSKGLSKSKPLELRSSKNGFYVLDNSSSISSLNKTDEFVASDVCAKARYKKLPFSHCKITSKDFLSLYMWIHRGRITPLLVKDTSYF